MPALSGPELDYVLNCSGCHHRDGSGVPGAVPPLAGIGRFLRTAEGRSYLVAVPGVAQAPLSDERLAALLDWLVERIDGYPPEPRYRAAEVAAARARPLRNAEEERRRILAAIARSERAGRASAPGGSESGSEASESGPGTAQSGARNAGSGAVRARKEAGPCRTGEDASGPSGRAAGEQERLGLGPAPPVLGRVEEDRSAAPSGSARLGARSAGRS